MKVTMILPALTEATSPFWRPIKYSLFPPLGLATLAGYLDDDWEIDYKNCGATSSVNLKTVKECRADGADGKPFWFETRYAEFVCPDLTPRYRRMAISFKKLGPCGKDDYDGARRTAETFGETWTTTDKVVFDPPATGTNTADGGGKTGDGKAGEGDSGGNTLQMPNPGTG